MNTNENNSNFDLRLDLECINPIICQNIDIKKDFDKQFESKFGFTVESYIIQKYEEINTFDTVKDLALGINIQRTLIYAYKNGTKKMSWEEREFHILKILKDIYKNQLYKQKGSVAYRNTLTNIKSTISSLFSEA